MKIPGPYERIYFVHIRKTGGTSLNHMFLSLATEDTPRLYKQIARAYRVKEHNLVFAGWNKLQISKGNYDYAYSHHPLHELHLPANTFTITCFRDPVKRVVSLYNMLMHLKLSDLFHPGMKSQAHWLGDSFDDFLTRIPRQELLAQLFAFSPRFDIQEALGRIDGITHRLFLADFPAGVAALNEKLGIQLEMLHKKDAPFQAAIPASGLQRLQSLLDLEYQLLEKIGAPFVQKPFPDLVEV